MLPVYGLTPFTMQDFPDRTSCIIWFAGCNMRCKYCHNPDIVTCGKGGMSWDEVWKFLNKRQSLLEGVTLSGGECTLHPDIVEITQRIQSMGFKVKLDTNGTKPEVVKKLVDSELVDYIALDYKARPEQYFEVTGSRKYEKFSKTLNYLCQQENVAFEVRTTVHSGLHSEQDINDIVSDLDKRGYEGTLYLQNYRHCPTLGNMKEQVQEIDPSKILKSDRFTLDLRNF